MSQPYWRKPVCRSRQQRAEAALPVSAADRGLIDAALAAGRITPCPPAHAWAGGAFCILGREGAPEASETTALLRVERSA